MHGKENKQVASIFGKILVGVAIALLVSSMAHRYELTISKEQYVESTLVYLEMFLLLIIIILNVVNFIRILTFLFSRKFIELRAIFLGLFSISILILSMAIDAPTLIYLT